jgi:lipopolysaccharide export system protein LptC
MIDRLTAWFPIVLLAAVAAVTVWLDRQVQPPEAGANGRARHDPDYIVDNFTVTRIGPDGAVRYKLNARRMLHYPDDDTTTLDAPNLVNFRGPAVTVTATAKTATLSSNGENAYLNDDVRLVRAAYDDHSELTVVTTWLHVIPNDGIAKTDKPVHIHDANTLITSDGLEFDNETHILKLLSNVRGRYEKKRK